MEMEGMEEASNFFSSFKLKLDITYNLFLLETNAVILINFRSGGIFCMWVFLPTFFHSQYPSYVPNSIETRLSSDTVRNLPVDEDIVYGSSGGNTPEVS